MQWPNGILKADFRLNRVFKSHAEALLAVNSAIDNYNKVRPHMSCGYLTPDQAHELDGPMQRHWKKKVYGVVLSAGAPTP
jgi:transposase InsO family protein